jgi:hypothetical protein
MPAGLGARGRIEPPPEIRHRGQAASRVSGSVMH